MTKYNEEFFNTNVLVIRQQFQIEELLKNFKEQTVKLNVKEFPMIVYQGLHQSIDISEITENNLTKLKSDKSFKRKIVELL